MIARLKNWLKERVFADDEPSATNVRSAGVYAVRQEYFRPAPPRESAKTVGEDIAVVPGNIVEEGPGKNVLIRNRFVREDTGTHETLKILDDSLVDSGEETGIDPYNTGGFDRSKNWNNRFRK